MYNTLYDHYREVCLYQILVFSVGLDNIYSGKEHDIHST